KDSTILFITRGAPLKRLGATWSDLERLGTTWSDLERTKARKPSGSRPTAFVPRYQRRLLIQRFCTRDDLEELRRDRRLARLVVLECQGADHFGSVLGRRIHRRHTSTELRRHGFIEGAQDRNLDVHRH